MSEVVSAPEVQRPERRPGRRPARPVVARSRRPGRRALLLALLVFSQPAGSLVPALPGAQETDVALGTVALAGGAAATAAAAAAEPARTVGRWWREWRMRLGVFALAMAILGFLGYSALLAPPLGAWFIYLFLMPFLVWIPGWTLHPIAGWLICGSWAALFPWLRRRLRISPSGRRWRRRQLRRWAAFGGGEISYGGQAWSGSSIGRSSTGGSRGSGSSTLTGGGGRFGGGGASSRW